jgi:sulfane dehydrogenase subunit SoxC
MTSRAPNELQSTRSVVSRRGFLGGVSVGIAGSIAGGPAGAETLADVPPRESGADLGAHSERSKFVKIGRIPEAAPGKRNVDPADAINSKTPHQKLVGSITPSDLHYERSHSGVPELDPAKHRLLIHGMVQKPLVFSVDDLKAMPSISRVVFIECTGRMGELEEGRSRSDRAEHAWSRQHQ